MDGTEETPAQLQTRNARLIRTLGKWRRWVGELETAGYTKQDRTLGGLEIMKMWRCLNCKTPARNDQAQCTKCGDRLTPKQENK